jgi:NAD(P)-dependent dehydrogenase (short-subunit alcohol dehydrogenase family)
MVLFDAKDSIESEYDVSVDVHPADLSDGEVVRALAAQCGDIDILVNNAGAIPRGDLWQIDEANWREVWDLKVFGYINMCRAVYSQMLIRGKGVIINVIGAAGERPNMNYIAGGSGNAALMGFTKGIGGRSLSDGIRVVGVNPGFIQTQRLEKLMRNAAETRFGDPARWQELLPKNPPPGRPRDVANLVVFLASDRAGYISGTVVTVDGGLVAA